MLLALVFLTWTHCASGDPASDPRIRLDQVDDLDVSSRPRRAATAEHSGRVLVWDWDTGNIEHDFLPEAQGAPVCVRFIESIDSLLLAENTGKVRVWNLGTGTTTGRYTLWDESYVSGCDATYRGDRLALLVSSNNGHSVYELEDTVERVARFGGDGQDVAVLSPDGTRVLIASNDSTDALYDIASGEIVRIFNFSRQVQAIAFSADAEFFATGTYRGLIDLWDARTGKLVKSLVAKGTDPRSPSDPGARVWDLSISSNGKQLAAAHGTKVTTWELASGRKLESWKLAAFLDVAFLDDDRVVSGTKDGPTILTAGSRPLQLTLVKPRDTTNQPSPSALSDALFAAIKSEDAGRVASVLAEGADPNLVDDLGATPMWLAAGLGNPQSVVLLLEAGAKVNARSLQNSTALWMAAQKGNLEIAEILIEAGADIDARDTFGGTALQWAAFYGRAETVELLLAHEADPTLRRESGETAQDLARFRGHEEIAAMLEAATARQ